MKKRYGFYAVKRSNMEFIVVEAPNDVQAEIEARNARQHCFILPKDVKEAFDRKRPGDIVDVWAKKDN
jgi:hypothetical protein